MAGPPTGPSVTRDPRPRSAPGAGFVRASAGGRLDGDRSPQSRTDSVQFCLSKGLAAPGGSLIVGSAEFIVRARWMRKLLGGGMRQVGVLAAAGLIALDTMVDRLAEDHAHARRLAEGLAILPGLAVDLTRVQTNIVIFHVARSGGATRLVDEWRARKVKVHAIGPTAIRCVPHKDVDAEDVERALSAFRELATGS